MSYKKNNNLLLLNHCSYYLLKHLIPSYQRQQFQINKETKVQLTKTILKLKFTFNLIE